MPGGNVDGIIAFAAPGGVRKCRKNTEKPGEPRFDNR